MWNYLVILVLIVLPRQLSLLYLLCSIYLLVLLHIYITIVILNFMIVLMLHLLRTGYISLGLTTSSVKDDWTRLNQE
jgi:hypothetical protein